MSDAVLRTLILAVPGTQDTHVLDLDNIRAGVARGEIAPDNWAWSPSRNEWLPLAQLPEYAEVPVAAILPIVAAPVVVAQAAPVRVVSSAHIPAARQVTAQAAPGNMAATYYSKPIEEHREFPIFKVLFTVLGLLIVALICVNYFLVDQPFRAALAKTSFSNIQAHAHLGAFAQPNTMLIHIVPNAALTDDNFADFLTALAQSAPRTVIAGKSITTLGLTSKWLSQYVITSDDWDGFADMSGYSLEEKKKFVLEHLEQADGAPIYVVKRNEKPDVQLANQNAAWDELVRDFNGHGV
jgi:hypothetical protein